MSSLGETSGGQVYNVKMVDMGRGARVWACACDNTGQCHWRPLQFRARRVLEIFDTIERDDDVLMPEG